MVDEAKMISIRTYFLMLLFCGFLDGSMTYVSFAGMPTPQKELTDEFNVLEAGLWNSISLNKGTHSCHKFSL